ncbi:MAG: sensor histidine kinase [Xenococcaceae cyanobacterium]
MFVQKIVPAVRYLIKRKTHPLRLLLYLEWILFGITIVTKFSFAKIPPHLPPFPPFPAHFSPFSILSIIAFGLMGLWLPNNKYFAKILYIVLGFALIGIAAWVNARSFNVFPALLLIMVIRGCSIFKFTGSAIVAGLSFSTFVLSLAFSVQNGFDRLRIRRVPTLIVPGLRPKILHQSGFDLNEEQLRNFVLNMALNSTVLFGLIAIFVLLLVNALLAEYRSRQELAIANEQLRNYALLIEDRAMLQERNRIAREIHDSLGHSLTAQSIQLANALLFLRSNFDKAQKFVREAKQLGAEALQQVRHSVATLRADPLQGKLLQVAIAELVTDLQRRTEIIPHCAIELPPVLPNEITVTVYRIVQEALTNIIKHSEATEVKISLKAIANSLEIFIKDNGNGFYPKENTTGFGLQGMRERTAGLGGTFSLSSSPLQGCQIIVKIPLTGDWTV